MSFLKALPAAALLFLPPSAATVHSLSVVPSSGKTEVVIGVNAAVDVQNFTLEAPARVVVDLKGASLAMAQRSYDKISRGGITNVRYSQFRPNVVRVVIDLDAKRQYDVKHSDTEVRITFSGGKTTEYSSWSSSKDGYVAAPRPSQVPAANATVDVKKAPTAVATATVHTTAAKVVAQVETQSTQPDQPQAQAETQPEPRYTPAAPARTPPRAARTDDIPVALFSQAQQSQQPLINVTFQDTDIRDVIASFAAFSGRTIVVG
ncbi:MAG TPA: AMIN domain-containing protein, partial [Gemmatimonadaceae bacterium]|nr:AMIN domain-containing protein [Gemmatimonadaceae bacterium]